MPPQVKSGSGVLQQQANPLDMSADKKFRLSAACHHIEREMTRSGLARTVRGPRTAVDVFPERHSMGTVLAYMLVLLDAQQAGGASAGFGWRGRPLTVQKSGTSLRVQYDTSAGQNALHLGTWRNCNQVLAIAEQRPAAVAACVVAQEVLRDLAATTRAAVVARVATTCAQLGWPVHELDEQSRAVFQAAVEVAVVVATNTAYGAAGVVEDVKRRAEAALKAV